jgi:hypothetical protein
MEEEKEEERDTNDVLSGGALHLDSSSAFRDCQSRTLPIQPISHFATRNTNKNPKPNDERSMFRKRPAAANKKAAKPLRARGGRSDGGDSDSSNEHEPASESGKNRPAASRAAASAKGGSNDVDAVRSSEQQQRAHGSSSARGGDKLTSSSSSSLHQVIEKTKRKRKLLTELQYKRGTDAAQLLVRRTLHDDGPKEGGEGKEAATGSGSVGLVYKRKLEDDDNPESTEPSYAEPTTVLERKHQQAMREFIQRKLKGTSNTTATDSLTAAVPGASKASGMNEDSVDGDSSSKISSSLLVQTDLFAELADQAKALQGGGGGGGASKVDHKGGAGTAAGENESAGITAAEDAGESTATASSTVMLHGTGIVEVILPTRSRAQQTTELVEAAEHKKRQQHLHRNNKRQRQTQQHHNEGMGKQGIDAATPVSAAAAPKAQPHKLPSRPTASAILPSRFTTYQPPAAKMPPPPPGHLQQQQQQQHESSAAGGARTDATAAAATLLGSTSEGGAADNDRPGFAEFQRKQHKHTSASRPHGAVPASSSGTGSSRPPPQQTRQQHNHQQRASDHVVYKKFVTHQQTLPNKKR